MSAGDQEPLRFLTCGSVDDGKSTLIGRLLYDCGQVFSDQLNAWQADSWKHGTTGGELDFALLVDGLSAEREQGITIDVAYRYFASSWRKYIVADTPGHDQYTRNMATGASVSDVAVLLVDARKGILVQTRRHAAVITMMGIRRLVVAVNKMDLVEFSQVRFGEIVADLQTLGRKLNTDELVCIPVVARDGDNVATVSSRMPWYQGPTLLGYLETVQVQEPASRPFRMPVQWVNRPSQDFRGFCGTLACGTLRVGDQICSLPAGTSARVKALLRANDEAAELSAGDAGTVILDREIDANRGTVLCPAGAEAVITDQVLARVIWLDEKPMLPGRAYILKLATQSTDATVTELKCKIDMDTLATAPGRQLELNDIGECTLSFARPLVVEPYIESKVLGSFILIDKLTFATVGAGMIQHELRRARNIKWQLLDVTKAERAALKNQKPCCLWFTGLSGSGKSTIANLLDKKLLALGRHTYVLDGDNVRHGLNRDLGFTPADRVENVRRVAEVARLMVDAGLIVMASLISPFRQERLAARQRFGDGEFVEIFVDTPLEVCEQRDPKGLYKKARAGSIPNLTGVNQPYEAPESPEVNLAGGARSPEALVEQVMEHLRSQHIV